MGFGQPVHVWGKVCIWHMFHSQSSLLTVSWDILFVPLATDVECGLTASSYWGDGSKMQSNLGSPCILDLTVTWGLTELYECIYYDCKMDENYGIHNCYKIQTLQLGQYNMEQCNKIILIYFYEV
jgi:hypothetical protein